MIQDLNKFALGVEQNIRDHRNSRYEVTRGEQKCVGRSKGVPARSGGAGFDNEAKLVLNDNFPPTKKKGGNYRYSQLALAIETEILSLAKDRSKERDGEAGTPKKY